jgi:FAD/FMN-containing dehydrogenase
MEGAGNPANAVRRDGVSVSSAVHLTPGLTQLSGWGANLRADCVLTEPETERELASSVDCAGTVPRGLGRSYGDAALNRGGRVVGTVRFDRYLAFDDATGTLTCEVGVSLADIIRDFAPRG